MLSNGSSETGVSIVMIPHNDALRFETRLLRDIIPTIQAHSTWTFQIVIIDNSDEDKKQLFDFPILDNVEYYYQWAGINLMYGPAMNLASKVSCHPFLVYVCTNHGRMYDPSWIDDLLAPMIKNPNVAMTGSHYPSCSPDHMGFPSDLPAYHIQGGIFGARTEALVAHPYTTIEEWKHWGSDIYQSFQLLNAGFDLENVETVKSVWRQSLNSPNQWKYVHDNSED